MRSSLRASLSRRFAAGWRGIALAAAALLANGATHAQTPAYFNTNCSGCHGNPVAISSVADNRGFTVIGVGAAVPINSGTDWLRNDAAFIAQLFANNAAAMVTLRTEGTSTNRDIVRAYLQRARDGVISSTALAYASTNIGASRFDSTTLSNERFLAATFSVSKSGTNPADFTVTGCGLNVAGNNGSVPSAGSCNVTVEFSPLQSAATSRTADLTVTYSGNEGGNPLTRVVTLTGSVPPAALSTTPNTTTTSARVDLGQFSDSNIGTLTNSGQATLSITSIALTAPLPVGATYVQITSPLGSCSATPTLTAGQSCNLWVRFTPQNPPSTTTAIFRINPSVGANQDLSLQGTGTRPLISPIATTLAFGNVQQGVPSALPLQINNTGNATLTFTAPLPTAPGARTGAAAGDYAVSGCGASIPAGGNCTLTITLTPSALGSRPATLTVSSDAPNGPLVVTLTGTGVALPEPVVVGPASDFPDTVINEVSAQTRTVTITNSRTRAITYTVANLTDFRVAANPCAGTVPGGGGSCTVTLDFRPTLGAGEGQRIGSFVFDFAGTLGDADPNDVNVAVAGNALLPLGQSASSINAAAVVGSPTTSSVVLTNRASTPITLATLVFSGAAAADYSLDAGNTCTPALVLAASTSCTLVVRFNPPTAGSRNATLTITHSAAGSPQTVAYVGTATPAPQGRIELGAFTLSYPDTQLLGTSALSLIVSNSGDLALTFSAFNFGGANPGDFSRSGTCSTATPLPIAGQCTLTVTFAPSALGVRSANLTILSDASNGPATITLSGTGVPIPVPVVSLTPATLDFGNQTTGGLYPARRVRLANTGTADLAISAIAVTGAGFSNVSAAACPIVLAPGAGCDIDIALAATSAIAYTGSLQVTSNAAGSPHTTVLRGTGTASAVPVLVWSPAVTQLDFGAVSVGSVSAIQSVTVLNQGPGGATLTVLNAVGFDAGSFSVVAGTCAIGVPLFEGDSCRVDIRFAPGSSGNKSATVQIASTGSFPVTLSLIGVGLAGPNPGLGISATNLAFGTTRVGTQSLPAELRLTSNGSGTVRVTALAVTGTYAIQSTTCPAVPFTLAAGSTCTVFVVFMPSAAGTASGMLSVTSDSSPVALEVVLIGIGEAEADVGGGGCSLASGPSLLDPTLWLLALLAAWVLLRRRRSREAGARQVARSDRP